MTEFPILQDGIYANHAALSPWPAASALAIKNFADENTNAGPRDFRSWMERERALRIQLQTFIGAETHRDIALLKNTTEGICTVAYGITWNQGDNIVLPAHEFPSNRLPWMAQDIHGVEIREVNIRENGAPEQALINAMDDRTRVLAVSSVQYGDGFRLNLKKLGTACAQTKSFYFVDAIQQMGVLPIDVADCQIDFLAADGHKWLLAPEGVAVFYSRPEARATLRLNQTGWHMYDFPWNFSREDWTPSPTARCFEAGSPNSLGQVGLHASLKVLLDHGLDHVSGRVLANTDQLMTGLSSMAGLQICSDQAQERRSGIVSFKPLNIEIRDAYKKLNSAGVTTALRGGYIRLSPHFYQGKSVIDQLLNKIESVS